MRTIKFRAWNKERKFMSPTFDIKDLGKTQTLYGDWELMQFTNLLDKNGKEIYEEDIVEWQSKEVGSAYGVNRMSRMVVEFKDQKWNPWLSEAMEVIGNIYDNPELIKK